MAKEPKLPFDERSINLIKRLAGQGLTQTQVARCLGISEAWLKIQRKEHPEFDEAYQQGRSEACEEVTGKLFELIRKGDRASIFFYLKTQMGWRETERIEHTGKDGGSIKYENDHKSDAGREVTNFIKKIDERNPKNSKDE